MFSRLSLNSSSTGLKKYHLRVGTTGGGTAPPRVLEEKWRLGSDWELLLVLPAGRIRPRPTGEEPPITNSVSALATTGQGTCSSPIDLDSSPASSPRNGSPPKRRQMSSPASSRPSSPSPQLRPSRVQPSSPIPSSQPRHSSAPAESPVRKGKGRVVVKEEDSNSELEILEDRKIKMEKVQAEDDEDFKIGEVMPVQSTQRPSKCRQTGSADSADSADEISAQLAAGPASSPIASVDCDGKSRKRRKLQPAVEIPVSTSSAANHSQTAAKTKATKATKDSELVDLSTVDMTEYPYPLPNRVPRYMHKVMQLLRGLPGLEMEVLHDVVETWLTFELRSGYGYAAGMLTTEHRPEQVSQWIMVAHRPNFAAVIPDLEKYAERMERWWYACSPKWRQLPDWKLKDGSGPWDEQMVSGVNGLANMVVAMVWWHHEIAGLPRSKPWENQQYGDNLERFVWFGQDVDWVLHQIVAWGWA
ncbi:SERTA domain-containing protein 3 [Marasmius crinis-equi]|uniref:SERTA domain-containing protein 3 n=1 Tax=Marasmius crinis-equi TaxID=585013 RepID=A0ABR3FCD0_9AGAR